MASSNLKGLVTNDSSDRLRNGNQRHRCARSPVYAELGHFRPINRFKRALVRVAKEVKFHFSLSAENKNNSITSRFAHILDVFLCVSQNTK